MVMLRWWGLALALIIALTATASAQGGNEAAAQRAYKRGYLSLQAGNYADALTHYRRSYELAPRPRTLFNMALCEEKLGQEEAAYRHYTEFVATAEERDRQFVAQAQERVSVLGNALQGRVTIESDPSGAEVRIDGNRRSSGTTPLTVNLRPGEHYVHVSTPWSRAEERLVTVEPRGRAVVNIALVPSSSVEITVEPHDATIAREGEERTAKGRYQARVRPGKYRFEITRPGYVSEKLTLRVKRGASVEQTVRLRPRITNASLIVQADGAVVEVDGEAAPPAGEGGRRSVVAGPHRIRVERDGYQPWEQDLHLSPGESITLDVDLARHGGHRTAWWLGLGAGVGVVAAGAVVGVMGLRDVANADMSVHDRGKSRALAGDIMVVVGTVAIVTAWRFLRSSSSSARIERSHGGF